MDVADADADANADFNADTDAWVRTIPLTSTLLRRGKNEGSFVFYCEWSKCYDQIGLPYPITDFSAFHSDVS